MAVDVSEPGTPGWWMKRLAKQLEAKATRYGRLDDYYLGNPPLPLGAENSRAAFQAFQRSARSNFAALIVQAPRERLQVRAIRTAAEDDDNGDEAARAMWQRNDCDIQAPDVHRFMLEFSEAYVAVGLDDDGKAVITAEDPRQVITAHDPATRRTLAALKLLHDDATDTDYAYLWLPGERYVATRHRVTPTTSGALTGSLLNRRTYAPPVRFSPASFTLQDEPETYEVQDIPVVRFANRDGVGEFETHTDLLDRINHMLLQRMVIATLQAFRQRAIEIEDEDDLPDVDDEGNKVDYDDIFAADPGALWKLPAGAKIWESGQADLTPILSSVKDDVLHLAAVTRTPLTMFTPDAATQTAEGASLQREGLVFKVEDIQRIAGRSWARVVALGFALEGDDTRSDLAQVNIDWAPAERFSLAERADAAVKAKGADVPWYTRGAEIWQFTPDQLERQQTERSDDALQLAMAAPAPAATPAGQADAPPAV